MTPETTAAPEDPQGPPVLTEIAAGIGVLTMNRPQGLNLLTRDMIAALHEGLRAFGADKAVRVIVLAAKGRGFCAGHDLKAMADAPEAEMTALFSQCEEMMNGIRHLPKPVIAQVQGMAAAAGVQLVASCDLVMASSDARFGTTGVRAGLFCSVPMVPLSRIMKPRKALEMLFTGEPIGAEEAEAGGLVNHVAAPEALEAETRALAGKIAVHSPFAIGLGKEGFYEQIGLDYDAAYAVGKKNMVRNAVAPDGREGMHAFLEKRPPTWQD